ncbi:MAG: hypothetical protein JXR83_05250 [Deltaproteobacteria bacterium]|nr:hypothetical protein [Deltaproteobacteria bacterium]
MTRISKQSVHAALERAARNIIDAGGADGRISRADIRVKLEELSGTEKKLTDIFYRFMDHRDFKAGAQLTRSDVERAVAYAREKMVDKYDLNNNGLSKSEIAKMSLTGKLAVDLAKQLKGAAAGGALSTSDLGKAMAVAAKDTYYISESDSQPTFVATPWPADRPIAGGAVMTAFEDAILAQYLDYGDDYDHLDKLAFDTFDAANYLAELAIAEPDADDYYQESAAGFARIKKIFDDNLTDVHAFKVGPRDEDTGGLATDRGAYQLYLVGRTRDGNLAGVTFEAVET